MKISLVIPFHNTPIAQFRASLISLQEQTLRECEFILVDDWSTDTNVIEVAHEFIAQDSRFLCVRDTEWGHEGGAREYGYHQARGAYVWFFDSDDQLSEPRILQHLVELMEEYQEPEVLLCQEKHITLRSRYTKSINVDAPKRYLSDHDQVLAAYRDGDYEIMGNTSPHNKIFKREFLASVNFSCAKHALHADIIFVIAMALADTILSIHDIYYLVVNTPNSLTKLNPKKNQYEEVFRLLRHTHQFYLLHYEAYQPLVEYMMNWVVGLSSYNRGIILSWYMNDITKRTEINREYYQLLQEILPHYPHSYSGGHQMRVIKESIYQGKLLQEQELDETFHCYFTKEARKIFIMHRFRLLNKAIKFILFKVIKPLMPKSLYIKIKQKLKRL